jgi:hypothetical protein
LFCNIEQQRPNEVEPTSVRIHVGHVLCVMSASGRFEVTAFQFSNLLLSKITLNDNSNNVIIAINERC